MISSKIASLEARLARLERLARQKTAYGDRDFRDNGLPYDITAFADQLFIDLRNKMIKEGFNLRSLKYSLPKDEDAFLFSFIPSLDLSNDERVIAKIERPKDGVKVRNLKLTLSMSKLSLSKNPPKNREVIIPISNLEFRQATDLVSDSIIYFGKQNIS
jgi:hypothetical protein